MMIEKKSSKRILPIIIIVTAIVVAVTLFIYPSIYDHQCKTRVYEDFQSMITNDVMNAKWIVIPYGAETYREYAKNKGEHVAQEEYYNMFSRGKVIAADEECDLAVKYT